MTNNPIDIPTERLSRLRVGFCASLRHFILRKRQCLNAA